MKLRLQTLSPWMVIVASGLFIGATARDCVFTDPIDTEFYSTHDALSALDGCTTIVAETIELSALYDDLHLPDVRNITGSINVARRTTSWRSSGGYPILSTIDLPNLEHLGALDVRNATAMRNISMPRLKDVGSIYVQGSLSDLSLDFRSLERVPAIGVSGRLEALNFDSLRTVDNDLSIDSCGACGRWDLGREQETSIALLFPSLVSVGYLKVSGYLNSINVANLVSAGPPLDPGDSQLSTDSGARLHLTQANETLSLNLTNLAAVDKQLYIWGEVGSLKMPALKTTNATIHIDASAPLNISLPLESAESIDLRGRITGVHLPDLSTDTSITLSSIYECEEDEHSSLTNVTCHIPSTGLSKAAKIGMGVGIAAGVVLIVLAGFFCLKRSRKRKADSREIVDLPAYGTGSAVPLQPGGRPETPPPPYSAGPT
ncbi:uncharacterized protein DSM5745_04593 [Aspergillus mulundensis]|uniref:Uncharacterized protein n=1 Tax=Aspergillus mulundensis TaxID=1810919 RepID=A0A3D8S457_9EURO|nr:hypothetical protein DSM5745_04593 [Aspergillus mulundensis]RDW81036.1 hypothetical protein DSM5745_04593 [Aspergillus mulundensis]